MPHNTREQIDKFTKEAFLFKVGEGEIERASRLVDCVTELLVENDHQLQKAREEERKQVLWNIGAMIEKAEFDAKVAERTGDATATWEVQSVIKQIQTIIDRYNSELDQDKK